MAIFKVPRITTSQRDILLLEVGEIVYDVDQDKFYGGDGSLGGFLIGSGIGNNTITVTLTQTDILNKYIVLPTIPFFPERVNVTPIEGIGQVNGIDFQVNGNILSWNGLGLDNFLEEHDVLIIQH